jgi:phosphatidylglycerophosphate synthase
LVTIKKIKQKGQPNEGLLDDFYEAKILRRVSPYLTKLFIDLHVSANFVTLISMIVVLAAGVLFIYFDKFLLISWILYLIVYNLLDNVDGEVARTTNTQSQLGRKMELATHILVNTSFLFFTGTGIYLRSPSIAWIIIPILSIIFSLILYRQVIKIHSELNEKKKVIEDLRIINREIYPGISWFWRNYQRIKNIFELNRFGFLLVVILQAFLKDTQSYRFLYPLFIYFQFRCIDLVAEIIVNNIRFKTLSQIR